MADDVAGFTVGGVAVSAAVLFGTALDAAGAVSAAGALLGAGSTATGNCDVGVAGATGSTPVRFDIQSHPAATTTRATPAMSEAVRGAGRCTAEFVAAGLRLRVRMSSTARTNVATSDRKRATSALAVARPRSSASKRSLSCVGSVRPSGGSTEVRASTTGSGDSVLTSCSVSKPRRGSESGGDADDGCNKKVLRSCCPTANSVPSAGDRQRRNCY